MRSHTDDRNTGLHVVIYDGQCRFCVRQIERLRRLDWGTRLEFLSLHSADVARRFPDITHERLMTEMAVITPAGRRYFGAAALRLLSRRLPTLWLAAAPLHIPFTLPFWSWLYDKVARRRYLFGRVEACEGGTCEVHRKTI